MKCKWTLCVFLNFSFFVFNTSFAQEEITLERVVALALEKNYDVQLAENVSEAAATDNAYSFGVFIPQIEAIGATQWNSNNQELRFVDESRNNSGKAESNNITATAQLTWMLFDGTRMFATRERVAAIAAQGELFVKNQMVNTIADVASNYFNIVRQKQQLRAIEEQMAVSEERVKLAERKLQVGTGAKPELLQAKVDYNAQRTQVVQQEALILALKEQLNALVGMQLPAPYEVPDTIIVNLNLQREELSNNIENSNFGLQVARSEMRISDLALRERKAELFPFISFNAAYNYSKTDNTQLINPFGALYNKTDGYNYGFSVNVPILTGFNQRRLIQQARINTRRQSLVYEQQKIAVDVGLQNAYVAYDNAKKVLLIEEENIKLAKENVSIALETFKRGATTFVELRTAQQSLAEAYTRLINARYLAKEAEIELLRLNGGLLR
ncbi:MAG TPA: TolC family protein [Chryseolinea sp.]